MDSQIKAVGLTTTEVEKMKEQGFVNTSIKPPSKSVGQIIAGNTFTYFNFVFALHLTKKIKKGIDSE